MKAITKRQLTYKVPVVRLALVREPKTPKLLFAVHEPKEAAQFLAPLRLAPEEWFIALLLNVRNEVVGLHEVSKGTISSSLVHPREVFKAAILCNASAMIVAHNHPSGNAASSADDRQTTQLLVKAGEILGIRVLDHLILAGDDCLSLRENEPQLFI